MASYSILMLSAKMTVGLPAQPALIETSVSLRKKIAYSEKTNGFDIVLVMQMDDIYSILVV